MRSACEVGPQPIPLAVERDRHGLHLREVAHEVGPGNVDTAGLEPPLQVDLQPQRQEAGDDVPDTGVVPMLIRGRISNVDFCSRKVRSTRHRLL